MLVARLPSCRVTVALTRLEFFRWPWLSSIVMPIRLANLLESFSDVNPLILLLLLPVEV